MKHWRVPLAEGFSTDIVRVLGARGIRAFGDGYVALLVPIYLYDLGFSAFAIGTIVAGTLTGTALLTFWVGMVANRYSRRRLLIAGALLMAATGFGFAALTDFWPLLIIAFVGTMNPTTGDASVFQPLEHTVLTQTIDPARRTALFARYSVVGSVAGALGVLAAALPDAGAHWFVGGRVDVTRLMFLFYGVIGVGSALLYCPLTPAIEHNDDAPKAPLGPSKKIVYGLAGLFGMNSFGTGFLVQSLLALWLYQRFQVSVTATASILFWSSLCSTVSYLVAVPIARRIGLIKAIVFTHLPSNVFLVLIPFSPNLTIAILLLLARSVLSEMDVPTSASYIMAVVRPEERPAAASLTAISKIFARAAGSVISGYLLTLSSFGWPLVIGGLMKGTYDILLLVGFQKVRPPEEMKVSIGK